MASNRVLHILSPTDENTPSDARLIPATECPHDCTASPATHDLLDTPGLEHVVVCINCFTAEET